MQRDCRMRGRWRGPPPWVRVVHTARVDVPYRPDGPDRPLPRGFRGTDAPPAAGGVPPRERPVGPAAFVTRHLRLSVLRGRCVCAEQAELVGNGANRACLPAAVASSGEGSQR